MLIVFVVLGVIFLLGGLVFMGLYIYKKRRELEESADRELVQDPFKEKNERFGATGF